MSRVLAEKCGKRELREIMVKKKGRITDPALLSSYVL
jgi:hypothetical protein